jgi:predicted transcriptional regulator
MPEDEQRQEILRLTSTIVAARAVNSSIPAGDLPSLFAAVYGALATLGTEETAEKPTPAIPIKNSVTPNYIVCLEDGTERKLLKRHLRTAHGMTPDGYRERWELPREYPLIAPNYAALRSKLAKKIGLGRKPGTKVNAQRKTKSTSKAKK